MAAVEDHSSTAVVLSAAQGLDNLACRNFPAYSSLCVHAAGGAGSEELTTEPRSRGSQAGDVLVEGQEDSATNAELSEGQCFHDFFPTLKWHGTSERPCHL